MSKTRDEDACLTLHDLLRRGASTHPQKPAIIYKDEKITYQKLDETTTRLANSFLHLGIQKGDRVGVLLPRIPEMVITYLALSKCGVISFPISHESPPEEINRILSQTGVSAVVVHTIYLEILAEVPRIVYLVVVGDSSTDGTYSFQDLLKNGEAHPCSVVVNPEDIFYLNFTSGTTGTPKGAVTTHTNIFYNTLGAVDGLGLTRDDIHMCMFAVYSHPHEIFARPLFLGGTLVLLDTIYPRSMAQSIEKNRVTCMMALPPFYEMLLEVAKTENFGLSSLRMAESGGMHTHEDLKDRFVERVGIRITAVWGSTETAGIAIANKRGEAYKRNSVGTPCKYYDVRVVDNNGRELPAGQIGQLTFRGRGVISRYYDGELHNEDFPAEGCYFSGDLGMCDEEGYFHFLGRKYGMLKVGGWKVYPLEIEIVLNCHPGIREAAVVGVTDRKRGEVPKAVIVLEGGSLTKQDITNYCRAKLARYKIPRIIEFVEELPKLSGDKLNLEALK